jgi:peptide-methionine (S)-S-oxide reductase
MRGGPKEARCAIAGRAAAVPIPRWRRVLLAIGAALVAITAGAQVSAPRPAVGSAPVSAVATFAGGCFWCMEPPYDKLDGVLETTSGYMGGRERNPTYEQVSSGATGHAEVVQVRYDPSRVTYERLLEVFWRNIDPTVKDRQFCDSGPQYRSAIFVHDDAQRRAAEASRAALEKAKPFKASIVTPVVAAGEFWPAEDYHQDYYVKNPVRYNYYRTGCGRDRRLTELWGSAPK